MAKEPMKKDEEEKGVPAAPKGAAPKQNYIKFLAACRKQGKGMKECALLWKKQGAGKEGGMVYAKATNRKRAARILRKKKGVKLPEGYGA